MTYHGDDETMNYCVYDFVGETMSNMRQCHKQTVASSFHAGDMGREGQ